MPPGGVTLTVGTGFTVTEVVYIVEGAQAEPVLLTINEYVPVAVGVAVGFCNDEVKPDGPDQDQAVALLEFAVNVTVLPIHIGPLLVAPLDVGTGFTVSVVV